VAATGGSAHPLFVDLDGSLLATDVLWESVLVLLKTKPFALLLFPFWLFTGKARFKSEIARRVTLRVATLPYRSSVLAFLREERRSGREIVLTTAADERIANSVAEHLQLFSAVLASDGQVNLSGEAKLHAIRDYTRATSFDYVGNSMVDLPVWRSAHGAILVSPSGRLRRRAAAVCSVQRTFPPDGGRLRELLRAFRVHQWVKNLLLFAPLLMAHRAMDIGMLTRVLYAFAAFCMGASSSYVFNDLLDLEADRLHPRKRDRPFAAGTLGIGTGLVASSLLLAGSLTTATMLLPRPVLLELLIYCAATTAYSLYLKRVVILDVLLLAGLYTIRVLAGGAAAGVAVSPWMLAFSMFLFLSLAIIKRYSELGMHRTLERRSIAGRGYTISDMELLRSVGPTSGYLSVLVLALYVNSAEVAKLYGTPTILWLIGPCLLYWISRLWLLSHRGEIDGDPIVFTVKDPVSYVVGATIVCLIIAASVT
jgi:4-hydroxybenzoate polyprenyltransferase